jgi:hypothetical protein
VIVYISVPKITVHPDSEEDYEVAKNIEKLLNSVAAVSIATKQLEKERTNMALFTITQEDLNKGKLVEPAVWYPVEIVKVEDKTAKTSGADMILVHLLITAGEFKGTTLYQNFMPDFPGFIVDFLAAIQGVERTKDFEAKVLNNPIDVSDKTCKGRKLEVYVTRGSYNNKPNNQIEGYRPAA